MIEVTYDPLSDELVFFSAEADREAVGRVRRRLEVALGEGNVDACWRFGGPNVMIGCRAWLGGQAESPVRVFSE